MMEAENKTYSLMFSNNIPFGQNKKHISNQTKTSNNKSHHHPCRDSMQQHMIGLGELIAFFEGSKIETEIETT